VFFGRLLQFGRARGRVALGVRCSSL